MSRATLIAIVLLCGRASQAHACSEGDEENTLQSYHHPDLPLDGFVAGRLGLVQPTWARSYLVVVFRTLNGTPLSKAAQEGALTLWRERLGLPVEGAAPATTKAEPPAHELWLAARNREMKAKVTGLEAGYWSHHDYARVENCLPPAFLAATRTLAARRARYGAGSPALRAWITRQDAVFASCGGDKVEVPAAPADGDPLARADSAYQQAAGAFYRGEYVDAEARFRAIAADPSSPHAGLARYLVARTLTRRAVMLENGNDELIAKARAELAGVLKDRKLAALHGAARDYLDISQLSPDRAALARSLGLRLAKGDPGSRMKTLLAGYTFLDSAGRVRDPQNEYPKSRDDDRLSAFLDTLRDHDFERALRLYRKDKGPVWLLAALITADPDKGGQKAHLPLLLAQAERLDPSSPAYATARYHRLRLLIGQASPESLRRELGTVRAALRPSGPSTLNAYRELAFRLAGSLDELGAEATTQPAGSWDVASNVVTPEKDGRPLFHPLAAHTLTFALPTRSLVALAKSERLAKPIQETFLSGAFVRAAALDDVASARELAPLLAAKAPQLKPGVERIVGAPSPAARRFELAYLLTKMNLAPEQPTWDVQGSRSSRSASSAWCFGPDERDDVAERPRVPGPVTSSERDHLAWSFDGEPANQLRPSALLPFLTTEDRKQAEKESRALVALGKDGVGFVNRALVEVADAVADDPRLPEALHLAIQSSRHACTNGGGEATQWARRAMQLLHRKYGKTTWARKAKYYY